MQQGDKIYPQQWPAAFARTRLESLCALDIDSPAHVHRMANVVCTIGLLLMLFCYVGYQGLGAKPLKWGFLQL